MDLYNKVIMSSTLRQPELKISYNEKNELQEVTLHFAPEQLAYAKEVLAQYERLEKLKQGVARAVKQSRDIEACSRKLKKIKNTSNGKNFKT